MYSMFGIIIIIVIVIIIVNNNNCVHGRLLLTGVDIEGVLDLVNMLMKGRYEEHC